MDYGIKKTFQYFLIPVLRSGAVLALAIAAFTLSLTLKGYYWLYGTAPFLAICIAFFGVSFGELLYCFFLVRQTVKTRQFVENDRHNVWVVAGDQGSGKSELIKKMSVVKSDWAWRKLNEEYTLSFNRAIDRLESMSEYDVGSFQEQKEAFDFYAQNPTVQPCLAASCPMKVDGRSLSAFNFFHIVQLKKVLYRTVVCFDEGSEDVPNDYSKDGPPELNQGCRFGRQFHESFWFVSEQNFAKLCLQLRNVALNFVVLKMDRVGVPVRWYRRWEKDFAKFQEKYPPSYFDDWDNVVVKTNSEEAERLLARKLLLDNMGFVRFKLKGLNGTEGNVVNPLEDLTLYFSGWRRYESPSRIYRDTCKSKDKLYDPYFWKMTCEDAKYLGKVRTAQESYMERHRREQELIKTVRREAVRKR